MIFNEYIAKIEGHGAIHVDWEKNEAKLKILEGERLFEGMLEGRTAEETHWITPRICGVCPIAHNLASLSACENAFSILPNQTTILLRKIMQAGQIIQSHFLHLFFLALPDYIGIDRGTELNQKDPKAFKMALALKEFSDEIVHAVAGRSIHPTAPTIGGFHKIPAKKSLSSLLEKLKKTRKAAEYTVKLFEKLDYPELKVDLKLVAQKDGKIISNKNDISLIKDYKKDIEEEARDYSTAKFGRYKKREVMVGALARMANLDTEQKSGLDFQNPFHNNLAQAVEILLYHKQTQALIEELLEMKIDATIADKPVKNQPPYIGIGAIEAPRGGLYHEFHFNENGIVTYANIITPTVQNLASIEKSANALLEQHKNKTNPEKKRLLEMLIRAYDPCITCSTH
jgi:coenzyme F420-reducing hydrogenase alpha subunit